MSPLLLLLALVPVLTPGVLSHSIDKGDNTVVSLPELGMSTTKDEPTPDQCLREEEPSWQQFEESPIPIPYLCKALGLNAFCKVCLRSIQHGYCGRWLTFFVLTVTGESVTGISTFVSNKGLPSHGGFLVQMILLVELVFGSAGLYVWFLLLMVNQAQRRQARSCLWNTFNRLLSLNKAPAPGLEPPHRKPRRRTEACGCTRGNLRRPTQAVDNGAVDTSVVVPTAPCQSDWHILTY